MSSLARLSVLTLITAACTVGQLGGGDPGGGTGSDPGSGSGSTTTGTISGDITTDQTWTGNITIAADTTIHAGATVTVAAGTMIEGQTNASVHVSGVLNIQGTKDAEVTILPAQGVSTWPGFVADTGGTISMSYAMGTNVATLAFCHTGATCNLDHVDFSMMGVAVEVEGTATISASRLSQVMDGGLTLQPGGNLKVVDTYLTVSTGDYTIVNGGTLDFEYSEVGDTNGGYIHCDFHINSATSVTIAHSNIRDGVYGMMIGGTTNAMIQYNNFLKNSAGDDIDPLSTNTTPNFEFDYWDQGAPTSTSLSGYDFTNPSATQLTDAGPRQANL